MRIFTGIFFCAVSLVATVGCNVDVKSNERTTSIDVVGEPADPTPDSMRQADILGSASQSDDENSSITGLSTDRMKENVSREASTPSVDSESEPDVAGGLGLAKPVSLKKQTPAPRPPVENKP